MDRQTTGNRKMYNKMLAASFTAVLALPVAAQAGGIKVYDQDGRYVKLGGRIQVQYHHVDPDGGDNTDDLFFRRLRPYIEGSVHKDWKGKFQWDMGKASGDNEIAIKDAYMQYTGFKDMKVTLGNANFAFSRELLTSSKKQQLVERTFVGDHNYGTPARNLGVHLAGSTQILSWGASLASSSIDPDADKLDFDTPVNSNDDFNEGWMYGGRVDFHPMGPVDYSQGDFDRGPLKAAIGIGAFGWSNDDDNNEYTDENGVTTNPGDDQQDVDSVVGFEVSGAIRVAGLSVDAQYNLFKADTIDSAITEGIYLEGETDLENFAVEGGYMIIDDKLELVAGYQMQDSDNYDEEWTRTSFGANYFLKKHNIKTQLTYRIGQNLDGEADNDENELFFQAQYVF